MTVGVLALQGAFREHEEMLHRMGVATRQVRLPRDLAEVDRLIIPGGESTTIGKLLVMYELLTPLRERILAGMPVWGTCAGAILMARRIVDGRPDQPALNVMDIEARRNAFGSQLDSFEAEVDVTDIDHPFHTVFIRAPILEKPGEQCRVLATLPDGRIVAARQAHMLATSFHPELTNDSSIHELFLSF
ncbi:MAG: pyridoxal 5'-phosphate synthase glutaminase subunit PdxT [Chloroflexi bacterium]|nr:pyridoxal 5'-phosphate synthase glutaminase subunit PdxT [Chloroflexota bacterium]